MLDAVTNRSLFEACVKRVANRAGIDEEIVRAVVQSALLEGVPPHHTLRGIYRRYTDERSKPHA